ncbi:DUF4253 domain-containing protein [Flindersiella endophytica]
MSDVLRRLLLKGLGAMALAGLAGCGDLAGEDARMPPGRQVQAGLWISNDPLDEREAGRRWGDLLAQHAKTGTWPLLLGGMLDRGKLRPWASGELTPEPTPPAGDLDRMFREQWNEWEHDEVYGWSTLGDSYGPRPFSSWPGLADAVTSDVDPDQHAATVARTAEGMRQLLTGSDHGPYLGLVTAPDGGAALTASGWYADSYQEPAIVVRSWQERFGVRVATLAFSTLTVTVPWPPRTIEQARRLCMEHYLFCPDNFWQAEEPFTFEDYAIWLTKATTWSFWWD